MCSWLILLFLLCRCSNGCDMCCNNCRNSNDCNRRNDNNCDCNRRNERSVERSNSCGCDNDDFIQTRTFSGFQNQSTCGCENKSE